MSALCNWFSLFVIKRRHKQRPVYLAWLHLLLPANKPGLVLFRSWGILLYLDQVWADDGAAPGIESVYLNTVFYPVFCISCWTRLIRLYRSSGHVKSQAGEDKKILIPVNTLICESLIPRIHIKSYAKCIPFQSSKRMTGKQKCCSVLLQSLHVFCGDTERSPLNVNTGSQMVKLLWLQGKDDISIMLSQHRGLAQVWWLLCPVPNPLFVFFSFPSIEGLQVKK